jgi:hypothetical protein
VVVTKVVVAVVLLLMVVLLMDQDPTDRWVVDLVVLEKKFHLHSYQMHLPKQLVDHNPINS